MPVANLGDLLNARLTKVERVERLGIGGDETGRTTTFQRKKTGPATEIYEPTDDLVRTPDGREVVLTARLYVDTTVDVQVGDVIEFVEVNSAGQVGSTHSGAEVRTRLLNQFPGGSDIDHLELGLVGG